jgi:hypothetical protein
MITIRWPNSLTFPQQFQPLCNASSLSCKQVSKFNAMSFISKSRQRYNRVPLWIYKLNWFVARFVRMCVFVFGEYEALLVRHWHLKPLNEAHINAHLYPFLTGSLALLAPQLSLCPIPWLACFFSILAYFSSKLCCDLLTQHCPEYVSSFQRGKRGQRGAHNNSEGRLAAVLSLLALLSTKVQIFDTWGAAQL